MTASTTNILASRDFFYSQYKLNRREWKACVSGKEDAALHVGNLHRQVTENELHSALQGKVRVVNITIPKRGDSTPAGYAIVQLESGRAAKAAVASYTKLELGGRRVTMWIQSSLLCPHESHVKGSDTLLFDNLAFTTTEATLYKFASQAGTVVKTRLARDADTNKSLGYGYVQMASPQEAAQALNALRDLDVDSQLCRVYSCLPPFNFA